MATKIRLDKELQEKIQSACQTYGLTPFELIHEAVENELKRLQTEQVREDISTLEIDRRLLAKGQSFSPMGDEISQQGITLTQCDLCLTEMTPPPTPVDGPLFCAECLEMSRGPDLHFLDTQP